MKTLLIINSKDRHHGTSSDFLIGFEQRTRVDNFRVNKIICPYSWFNFKYQSYVFNGITHFLAAGSYSITTLISTINTHIAPFIATYEPIQNKILFSGAGLITLELQYGPGYLGNVFGYTANPEPANPLETNLINLNLTSNIYVASRALTTYYNSIFNKKKANVFQVVPVDVNAYGYVAYENELETIFKCDTQTFSNLDIQLLDDFGEIIDLNGQNWILELELTSNAPFN